LSLAILGVTAVLQGIVVVWSGSVALLGDTTAQRGGRADRVPLGPGLSWSGAARRPGRYTYGYGRAEDLAGIIIVGFITASAIAAGWAAIDRLRHPAEVSHLGAVAGAAVVGFLGQRGGRATAGTGRAGGSGRPRWSRTGCTPGPTASPRSRCSWARAGWRSAGSGPTRWSGLGITVADRAGAVAGGPGGLPPAHGRRRSIHCGLCREDAAGDRRGTGTWAR
jgi:hypothetical protein